MLTIALLRCGRVALRVDLGVSILIQAFLWLESATSSKRPLFKGLYTNNTMQFVIDVQGADETAAIGYSYAKLVSTQLLHILGLEHNILRFRQGWSTYIS